MKRFLLVYQYLLLFLLIATSGFPFFYANQQYIMIGLFLAVVYLGIRKRITRLDASFVIFAVILVGWEFLQGVYLGSLAIRPLIGTIFRLGFAYFVLKSLGTEFVDKYLNIIKVFTIISLFFYSLFYVPNLTESLIDYAKNIKPLFASNLENQYQYLPNNIIFNFHGFEYIPKRNSGPFWEPGAFSIFLMIAIIFQYFKSKKVISSNNILFVVALATTFSTAGYLAFFMFMLMLHLLRSYSVVSFIRNFFVATLLGIVFFFLFLTLDFLGQKLIQNIDEASFSVGSRFGSALADLKLIISNPIIGYGRDLSAMYGVNYWDVGLMHRNNGFTKLFVTWGVLAIYILYRFRKSCVNIGFYYNLLNGGQILFFIILVLSFTQTIYQYPFFLGIAFWSIIYKRPITWARSSRSGI